MAESGAARAPARWGATVLFALPFAALAASTVHVVLVRHDDARLRIAYAIGFVLLEMLGLATSLYAGLRRGEDRGVRRAWLLLALSFVAMAAFGMALGDTMIDSASGPALAVMLVARGVHIAALLGALLSFPTRNRGRRDRAKLGFELTTAAGGGFLLVWYFVVGPALASPSVALTTVLFPVGDLMVMFGACAVLLRGVSPAVRRPLTMLLAGVALFFGADLYISHDVVYSPGRVAPALATLPVLVGIALTVGAAALHCRRPPGEAAASDAAAAQPATSRLPYVALAVGYGVLTLAAVRDGLFPWLGLVVGAIVMTGGIAGRQITALRDNHDLAVTDSLTGLASRAALHDRLRRAMERARRTGHQVGVLLIDLDGFKRINDAHGHEAGDRLLTAFAAAVRSSVRAGDVAGRLGGDEFAVVLDRTTTGDAVGVADRILAAAAAMHVPIGDGHERARASIGIAVARSADMDPDDLIHRADLAMYRAKRRGDHGWERYTDGLEPGPRLEQDLRDAVGTDQLHVVYQPIVALDTGQLTAVEALLRWDHPTLGPVSPQTFIPLAEDTGLIHELGAWVLEQACRQARRWQSRLPAGRRLYLSVNVSPHELRRESLAADVAAILARTAFAARDLVLEVTEGALAEGETTVRQLTAVRAYGVRVALDDFGTGYSSLRYLTRLPVDILKLDRCFVAELDGRPEGAAIAEAVIRLGQIMRLDTIAEGIEEPAQADELARLGYGTGQGYHFARPLTAAAVAALLDGEAEAGWPPLPGLDRSAVATA